MPENIPAQDAQAITLREHLEGRIAALAAALNDQIRAVEESSAERLGNVRRELDLTQKADREAIGKAEQAQQLRNEAMNEWRQTVTNLIARYVEQRQLDALEESIRAKTEALEKATDMRLKALEHKGSGQTGWMAGAAAMLALALTLFGLILRYVFTEQ